jgi:hypothetical protein
MKRRYDSLAEDSTASSDPEVVAYFQERSGKRASSNEFMEAVGGSRQRAHELCRQHNATLDVIEYYNAIEQYWQGVAQVAQGAQEQQNTLLRGYLNERLGEQVDFLEVAEDFDGVWPVERVADMWQACQLHNQLAAVQSNEEEEQLDYRQYFDSSLHSSTSNTRCVVTHAWFRCRRVTVV